MEHLGANSEGWNSSMNGMSSEESDFMDQLLGSLSDEVPNCSNLVVSLPFWPYNHESDDNTNINSNNNVYTLSKGFADYYSYDTHHEMSTADYYKATMEDADEFLNNAVLSNDSSSTSTDKDYNKNMVTQLIRSIEIETPMQETLKEDKSKKRPRNISGEVQKNTRNNKIKRAASKTDDDNDNTNCRKNDSSRGMLCSEEISSDSHGAYNAVSASSSPKDSAGLTLKLMNAGKVRANRGSATDPQSLYARRRRERINERLRILQKLVPNGTKVDISTMLEEAVQYVKFLQLQIKLLSSDELWMYAPLAYNGMGIGLA